MATQITHQVNEPSISVLFSGGTPTYRNMLQRGIRVQGAARRLCPVDTGRLRSSIHVTAPVRRGTQVGVQVGTPVEYAPHVEFGTGPRPIVPVNKQALRFVVDGQVVFAKHVVHPGTPAQPFLRPAVEAARGR